MLTLAPASVTAAPRLTPPLKPGQLFLVEDFAIADVAPMDAWERIVTIAAREQVSDIHLSNQRDGLHVALRLDGRLCPQGLLPGEYGQKLTNHVKVLARMDVGEKRRPQDGHLTCVIDGRPIDLRISLLPTNHGEDVAVRVLDRDSGLLELGQLGLLASQLRALTELIESPSGLLLVTGATGSGKTTSMYAALREVADGSRKIVTVENPIEYDLPGINQSQANYKLGLDFATLLRSVLRHDPNVIMIGEIRDAETAQAVVRAANSGRLVLATAHAADSASAVETLIALGAHPHFVARALRGVVAQTLVRRLCPYCTIRLEETADVHLFDEVRALLGPSEKPALSLGRGCPHCRHTGYRGRLGVFEVLSADDRLRDLISRAAPARAVYEHARAQQMLTIAQAGKLAALRGLTTIEELLQNVAEIWGERSSA